MTSKSLQASKKSGRALWSIILVMLGFLVNPYQLRAKTTDDQDKSIGSASVIGTPNAKTEKKTLESTLYRAPYPGSYKLVAIKNRNQELQEFWQARGELGKFGGTLTVSTFGAGAKTFNCWAANDAESGGIASLMYESLFDDDPWTGEVYPRLAKSISISDDKRDYTVTLRKGLKWSDGKPLTADDVVFTFGTLVARGFGNASMRDTLTVYGEYPSIKKIDDLTVRFHTKLPFAPFLSAARVAIAPKHILEPLTKRPLNEFQGFWDVNCDPRSIVVDGPFKLDRYVPGQRIELVPNPEYSMADKLNRKLPYLNKFVVLIVPDQNTQILKFYGQEIDLLDARSVRGFDAALMKQRERNGDFKMYNLGPDDGTMFLMFNLNRRKNPKSGKYYVDPIKQSWFNNDYFRQAVSHAISRERLVNNILKGVGYQLFTAESSASLYFNNNLKPYPQDLALAAALLKKGGFKIIDDKLFDEQGHRVEFTLHTNAGNSSRDATCVMIQDDLAKLGIKVNYQPIDFNILVDKTSESLDWEAVVMGLTGSRLEPYDGANVWKSDGRLHMFDQRLPAPNGKTTVLDARDWEKEIDLCFDRGATTFDTALRHKYFDRYQQIVYDKQPFIYLFSSLDITAMRNKIGNYMPTPLGLGYPPRGSLHNVEEIYIKQDKR